MKTPKKQPLYLQNSLPHHQAQKHQTKHRMKLKKHKFQKTKRKNKQEMLMPSLPQHSFLFFFLQILSIIFSLSLHHTISHTFIFSGCSNEKYESNSRFEANLNSLLSSIVSSSTQSIYNSFAIGNDTSSPPEGAIYGLYQCRGDLLKFDCSKCVESAVSQVGLVCPSTYGASLQLDGCLVRYENLDFTGRVDFSVRYRKCSKSVSNDVEFFRRRDDVLAELESGLGFRVSRSGLVEGFAQCVGDLGENDCSSCLEEAVVKLKSLCGSAEAGDVFLAQCYVRYWASGYYDSSPESSNDDGVGKTVAIIVGVIAGIAVVIVLLSVCRKACG